MNDFALNVNACTGREESEIMDVAMALAVGCQLIEAVLRLTVYPKRSMALTPGGRWSGQGTSMLQGTGRPSRTRRLPTLAPCSMSRSLSTPGTYLKYVQEGRVYVATNTRIR